MRKLLYLAVALAGCTNFSALSRDYGDLGDDAAVPVLDLADRDGSRNRFDMEPDGDVASDCNDQIKDGDESDVDCGGRCAPCDVGHVCVENGDCQTGACIASACELASGPPAWMPVGTAPTGNNTAPIVRYDLQMGLGSDGALYALGGRDTNGGALSTVERLDQTGAWSSQGGNLTQRRADLAVASVAGTLFAIDGDSATMTNANFQGSVEKSPMVDNFSNVSGLGDNRFAPAATVGADGKVYVFGGYDGTNFLTTGFTFGVSDTTSTPLGMLGTGRNALGAALGGDNRIYAIGGTNAAGTLASVEAYTTLTSTWTGVSPLPAARSNVPAATGPDGRIYVAGGWYPESGVVYETAVAYRAATTTLPDRWVPLTSTLASPRYRHAVATGADGRIYVMGGSSLQGALRTTEAYGPIVALSTASGSAGSTVNVSGSNFATTAAVKITIGGPGGTVIGTGTTDTNGGLATVSVMIPAGTTAGQTRIFATDARSRYPVSGAFNVTP